MGNKRPIYGPNHSPEKHLPTINNMWLYKLVGYLNSHSYLVYTHSLVVCGIALLFNLRQELFPRACPKGIVYVKGLIKELFHSQPVTIYSYWLGSRTTAVLFYLRTDLLPEAAGWWQQIRLRVKQNCSCPRIQSITVLLYTIIFKKTSET